MIIAFNHAPQTPRGQFSGAMFGFPGQGASGTIPAVIFQPGSKGEKKAEFWYHDPIFERPKKNYEIEIFLLNS